MCELSVKDTCTINFSEALSGELGIIVVKGTAQIKDEKAIERQMLVCDVRDASESILSKGSKLLLIGGEAFPEPRYLLWNFASSDKQRLQKAKLDWQERKFPNVPGDDTYVPIN